MATAPNPAELSAEPLVFSPWNLKILNHSKLPEVNYEDISSVQEAVTAIKQNKVQDEKTIVKILMIAYGVELSTLAAPSDKLDTRWLSKHNSKAMNLIRSVKVGDVSFQEEMEHFSAKVVRHLRTMNVVGAMRSKMLRDIEQMIGD